jgi:hypothetical protein
MRSLAINSSGGFSIKIGHLVGCGKITFGKASNSDIWPGIELISLGSVSKNVIWQRVYEWPLVRIS